MKFCSLKNQVPVEVVDVIIDYVDYEKYGIIAQKKVYQNVLTDVIAMNEILKPITPWIAKQCWGALNLNFNELQWVVEDEENIHSELDENFLDSDLLLYA